jgi:hypothetical protein
MTVQPDQEFSAVLADVVGEHLGHFGNQEWNPGITNIAIRGDHNQRGMQRHLRTHDDAAIVERLTGCTPPVESSYRFEGPAPLPILSGAVTVQVHATTDCTTEITWHGSFEQLIPQPLNSPARRTSNSSGPHLPPHSQQHLGVTHDSASTQWKGISS